MSPVPTPPPSYPLPLPHENVRQRHSSGAAFGTLYNLMDANNETHSIDAVIDRVHALASAVHDMARSAGDNVQGIGARGEETLAKFDTNFGAIQSDVQRIILNANARVEQAFPAPVLATVGACVVVLLVLVGLWLLLNIITDGTTKRNNNNNNRNGAAVWQRGRRLGVVDEPKVVVPPDARRREGG